MRLGQLARKYGISKKEVISYLKEKDPSLHSLGHNTKLDDQAVALVAARFENLDDLMGTTASEQPQVQDQDQAQAQEQMPKEESTLNEVEHQPQPVREEEVIETDKLLELLESEEETSVDLSKITLIKAPKKELEGLKVIGKIELPEPKKKNVKEEKEVKSRESRGEQREPTISEEEREKRRLKAKKRKQEYQARQEKRRKEKEKQQRKALNKARYHQKIQVAKASKQKQKPTASRQDISTQAEPAPAPPKTAMGKLWRWLTTY